jgi:hypothetical protein
MHESIVKVFLLHRQRRTGIMVSVSIRAPKKRGQTLSAV